MKQGSTMLARVVVWLMAIVVLSVCAILLPELAREETAAHPETGYLMYPFLAAAYVMSVPIFVALHQTLILLGYIDDNQAFSHRAVKALQNIKFCAIVFSSLIVVGAMGVIGLTRSISPGEDVAHIVTLGFMGTFASSVIAVFAAVLQKLLQNAIAMKSENDLTI